MRAFPATWRVLIVGLALTGAFATLRGDTVVLKNGVVYRGVVDRDKPMLWVYDGLKRTALRDSKVARIESDASLRNFEQFKIEQPLVIHGGAMPKEVVHVTAGPWNDRGRRSFTYEGARAGKVVRMEQAINELNPYMVKIRGVDGFWVGQMATAQIPREVVLGILGKVDRHDQNERVRVARFLIQAGWYREARAELDRINTDFRDDAGLRERLDLARASLGQLTAVQMKADIDRLRLARQPAEAASLLKSFPTKDVATQLETEVRELQRMQAAQVLADKALADELSSLHDRLFPPSKAVDTVSKEAEKKSDEAVAGKKAEASKKDDEPRTEKAKKATPVRVKVEWDDEVNEILKALRDAPDAVRDRFVAWQKAKTETGKSSDSLFALALSGYVVGADAAVEDLATARLLWTLRNQVRDYLRSSGQSERDVLLEKLETVSLPVRDKTPIAVNKLDTVTRLVRLMPPPLDEDGESAPVPGKPKTIRVRDDENAAPTDYTVLLPPEYHPLRSYPTVVALHDGNGPSAAVAWWSTEAARRGFIVIAPEYLVPDQGKEYRYTESEHAAVELALRDARRRFAVDSDRVFIGGQLEGANMAWDFALAHPDLCAGAVVVSGLPAKYVNRYLTHNGEKLPLYVVLGDLAPAANEIVFGQILKPLILKAWDVTYVEYFRRGLEDLPEEAPAIFDWMERKRRDPYPKSFEVDTARASDVRFFGVVVREFQTGRTTAPEAVDGFGRNLHPATIKLETSSMSNLLRLQTGGVKRLEVWVSPKLIDFTRKMEVRVNGRSQKGQPKPDLLPLLDDLRIRGDRQQVYWMKVTSG